MQNISALSIEAIVAVRKAHKSLRGMSPSYEPARWLPVTLILPKAELAMLETSKIRCGWVRASGKGCRSRLSSRRERSLDLWRSDALCMEDNGGGCHEFTPGRNNMGSRQHLTGKAVLRVLAESDPY